MGKVLVVKFDDDNRDNYLLVMELEKHEALGVKTGAEAVAALTEFSPDVIIYDAMLPDQLKVNFMDVLASNPRTASIPVISVSPRKYLTPEPQTVHYLTMPIDIEDLIEAVNRFLSAR